MTTSSTSYPDDWNSTSIGECCDILDTMRIPISAEERSKRLGDVPYYGANGQIGWIDDFILNEELVLVAEDGGFFDEYATRPIAYMIRGKSWINNHAHVLRAISGVTTNLWVYYNLVHRDIRYYIEGGTRSKLNQGELKQIEIPLPYPSEQQQIAEILDTLDRTITQTERLIEKLKAIKSGLLHDLLTRGIGEDGRVRNPEKHPEEFKDSEVGLIPKMWMIREISEIAEVNAATLTGSINPNYEIEYLDISSIERLGRVSHTSRIRYASAPSRARRVVRSGDTIVSTVRPYLKAISFIERASDNLIASTGFAVLSPNSLVLPRFLFQVTMSESFIRYLVMRMTGSNYPAVLASDVGRYSFPCPTTDEQEIIVKPLSSCDSRIAAEEAYHEKLILVKKGLMHDLLTGQVRVKVPKEKIHEP